MTPSQIEVLGALAGGPMSHRALCAAIPHRYPDTVRDARASLEPELVSRHGEKRAVTYQLTDAGRVVLGQGPPVVTTPRTTSHDARESSSKSLTANEVSSRSSSPATTTGGQGPPVVLDSQDASRLIRMLEAALDRISELERRVSREKRPVASASPVVVHEDVPPEDEDLVLERFRQMADDGNPVKKPQIMRGRVLDDIRKDSGLRAALERSRVERLQRAELAKAEREKASAVAAQVEKDKREALEQSRRELAALKTRSAKA